MKLKQYLSINNLSQEQFGNRVSVSQGMVSSVIHGRYRLRGVTAIRWAKETNWQVTPHELNSLDFPNPSDGMPK